MIHKGRNQFSYLINYSNMSGTQALFQRISPITYPLESLRTVQSTKRAVGVNRGAGGTWAAGYSQNGEYGNIGL